MAAQLVNINSAPETGRLVQPARVGRYVERSFAAIDPETLYAVLRETERGQTERWADLCEWIAEDDRVASVFDTRFETVASMKFDVLPGKGDPVLAKAAADVVRDMLDGVENLEFLFEEMLNSVAYGYSVLEHVWTRANGMWVSNPIAVRPRDIKPATDWVPMVRTFGEYSAQDKRATRGELQASAYNWIRVDEHPNKFISWSYRRRGSTPLKSGLMRSLAWHWLFKRWALKFWVAGAERLGNPIMIGKVMREAPRSARESLADGLENLSDGQAAILEEQTGIEFPDTKFSASADVWEKLVDKCDDAITIAVMGSLDNVDGGSNGSLARAESQAEVTIGPRVMKLSKALYGNVERDWLKPFVAFNTHLFGGRMPPVPRLAIASGMVKKIEPILPFHVDAGIVTRNEVRSQLGLDPLPAGLGGDEILRSSQPGAPGSPAIDSGAVPPSLSLPLSGGEPAALPLSRQLPLPLTETSQTLDASPPTLEHALASALVAPPSLSRAQSPKQSTRSRTRKKR